MRCASNICRLAQAYNFQGAMVHTVTPINDLSKKTIWANPGALAAGQLQNKVQAVLPRPRHLLRSQPGVSDGNGPVSR